MTALLITSVFPPQHGGSGRWFWEMYRRLPRADYVIAAGDCGGAGEFDAGHDLRIERMPLKFPTWGLLRWQAWKRYGTARRRLDALVAANQVRAIHAGCALPEGLLAWQLKRRRGLPYIVYVHGEELEVFRSSRELTWLARRVYRGADLLIANSHNTARLLREAWPVANERIQVLHPGVDTTHFVPAPRDAAVRSALGWGDRPVVLTVGRLQKRKGHDMMIRALPKIRQQVPEVLYAIVGNGEERESLERLVDELQLRQHVRFHGAVDDAQILRAYQQCDLFVLPNREVDGDFEGFGIVLLEAQACGKPVVAGQSGGTSETMRPEVTGLVVDCRQPQHLAEGLSALLLDERRRRRMGEAGLAWVVERFDWQSLSRLAERLFQSPSSRRAGVLPAKTGTKSARDAAPWFGKPTDQAEEGVPR